MPWHVHPQAQWNRFWLDDLDDLHQAEILVVEDMAVQDELADIVRVAGIDVHGLRNYLAIRPCPSGNQDGILPHQLIRAGGILRWCSTPGRELPRDTRSSGVQGC